ncbi:MAG: hypothetical protein HY551_05725 [Elusimicrobia bacterium]|nr:hypothetical protein [Elusimicrobiota bacterium]
MRSGDPIGKPALALLGAALVLAGIVLYYGARKLSRRTAPSEPSLPAEPARQGSSTSSREAAVPGASEPHETVSSLPPLLIHKAGRPASDSSKAPPAPPPAKK